MGDVEANVALMPRLFHRKDGTIKIKGVKNNDLSPTTEPACDDLQTGSDDRPAVVRGGPFRTRLLGQRGADSEHRLQAKAKAVLGADSVELVLH